MGLNTTKTIKKTSNVLGAKCDKTLNEIGKRMKMAGCEKYEVVKDVYLDPRAHGNDDVVFVGLNGVGFHFRRGEYIDMPKPLYDILVNAKELTPRPERKVMVKSKSTSAEA